MATVVISNLEKSYAETKGPGVKVVHGINLEIRDREFMVLVGPSGCGKSTTLRMIAGLEEITGGTISIDGVVVNNVLPKDRDIAMVFQNYALYPHMSVYENMAFGLKLRKFPKAEIDARVREASAMLGLDPYLDRKPKALSGASASASPSAAPSCANRRSSCSTSPSPTSTQRCASRPAPRFPNSTPASVRP